VFPVWVLDTGASNHMTGTRSLLTQLDQGVLGSFSFGDGSRVKIQGMGSVVSLAAANIVSLGQLEEKGFTYEGGNGRLCVYDQEHLSVYFQNMKVEQVCDGCVLGKHYILRTYVETGLEQD
jgi:hypothetical protein